MTHGRLVPPRRSPVSRTARKAALDLCLDPSSPTPVPAMPAAAGEGWLIEVLPHPGVTDAEGDSLADGAGPGRLSRTSALAPGIAITCTAILTKRWSPRRPMSSRTTSWRASRWRPASLSRRARRGGRAPSCRRLRPIPRSRRSPLRGLDAAALQALSASTPALPAAGGPGGHPGLLRGARTATRPTSSWRRSPRPGRSTVRIARSRRRSEHREPGAPDHADPGSAEGDHHGGHRKGEPALGALRLPRQRGRDRLRPRPRDLLQGRDAQSSQRHRAVRRREHRGRRRRARRARGLRRADRQHRRPLLRPARYAGRKRCRRERCRPSASTRAWWPASPTTATRWASPRSTARPCSTRATWRIRSSSAARSVWRRAVGGRRSRTVGDLIVVAGGRAGRDGIHGATFSSDVLGATHAELGSVVQIGDPIVEKRLADALPRARDLGLYSAITDCGAGGLSSAVGEMASELGADVELARVPLKYDGLRPWEIWLSEAQERMVLAVPPAQLAGAAGDLCRGEGVEATAIGHFTGDGRLRVRYDGKSWSPTSTARFSTTACRCAACRASGRRARGSRRTGDDPRRRRPERAAGASAGRPQRRLEGADRPPVRPRGAGANGRQAVRRAGGHRSRRRRGAATGGALLARAWPSAAASIPGTARSIRTRWRSSPSTRRCATSSPSAPTRRGPPSWTTSAGATRTCPTASAAWCEAAQGCHDAAVAFRVPFISGKDSLYNEYRLADGTLARRSPARCSSPPSASCRTSGSRRRCI